MKKILSMILSIMMLLSMAAFASAETDTAVVLNYPETLQKLGYTEPVVLDKMPERVVVEKAVAKRVAKNHKIRTDTGIEVTFPAELGENPEFIEFVSAPDGLISIQLKNIGHIENR